MRRSTCTARFVVYAELYAANTVYDVCVRTNVTRDLSEIVWVLVLHKSLVAFWNMKTNFGIDTNSSRNKTKPWVIPGRPSGVSQDEVDGPI